MEKCKSCKHWERPEEGILYSQVNQTTGKCLRLKMRDDVTGWERNEDKIVVDFYKEGEIAYVNDSSDYFAALYPTAEFGCVLHEKGE